MKSSFSPRKNKKSKIVDMNRSLKNKKLLKKKNNFNRSQIYNRSSPKGIERYRGQNEIFSYLMQN